MKKVLAFFLVVFLVTMSGVATEQRRFDRWHNFRFLIGTWKMEKKGEVLNIQKYEFMYNGKFLKMTTKSKFEPTEKNPKGEVHEDMGVFSYDGFRDKVVLRSFHSEGFINKYILKSVSEDGKILLFETENVENAPKGTIAKLEFKKINNNEFVQKFSVKFPKKEFMCFFENHFKRVK